MREVSEPEPVGPGRYPQDILEKYATLCAPPLDLPYPLPDIRDGGLPEDITLFRICLLIDHIVDEAPSSFHRVVSEWHRKDQEKEDERNFRRARQMAIYGRTYTESSELKSHLSPRVAFEQMLRKELEAARAMAPPAPTTPEQRWRSPISTTPVTGSIRGNRDGDQSDSSESEDERRLREVSPSPCRRPTAPMTPSISPVKRSISGTAGSDSAKRCRNTLEGLASPLRSALPSLGSFATFSFATNSTTSSTTTSRASRSTVSSTSVVSSSSGTPAIAPEAPSDAISPEEIPDSPRWKPQPAVSGVERTVMVTNANPYQQLFWKKDIRFHVQWELERLITQSDTLTWDDFQADDFEILAGDVRDAMPRVESVMRAVRTRVEHSILAENDIDIDTTSNLDPSSPPASKPAEHLPNRVSSTGFGINSNPITVSAPVMISDGMKRLYTEVDREENSIRAQDGKGLLSDDRDWPCGGKISYTIYVCPVCPVTAKKSEIALDSRIQLYTPMPESPTVSALSPLRQKQAIFTSGPGPVDSNDNPVGPSSRKVVAPLYMPFSMTLAPPKMSGKSFRLARRFGSRRILNFKFKDMKKQKERQAMSELFVGRQFALFGRIYRAIWAPADKNALFAVEVNDHIDGLTCPINLKRFDPLMPTFLDLVKSFNDLELKSRQAMAKWACRPQLLFSDSVPAVKVDPSSIGIIDDVVVLGLSGPATTEQTLTDGCGLMSEAIARQIGVRLECQSGRPCVVQIRLGGAKGLLVLMTPEQEKLYPGKSVLLRRSMVKSMTESRDPSLFIIDVVRLGETVLKTPAGLSAEAIIALNHRGISHRTLVEMVKLSLDQLRDQFLPHRVGSEDESGMRRRLTAGLYGQGGIGVDRKKRLCLQEAKSARVAGLIYDDKDLWDLSDDGSADAIAKQDIDSFSGQPSSLAENIYMAIDAGFDPRESAFVCTKLHSFMDRQILRVTRDFRIPVEQSLSAFIIPDPCGVLGPNEIYVGCDSRRPTNPETGCTMSHILGPVLAYRSPCKLPSDIRMFTAVYKSELRHLTDCIVMSASPQCTQSPASFLAGGDYDGDTATIIFDQALVKPFVQAADHIANAPSDFETENFEKELVQGTDFLSALSEIGADDEQTIGNYQTFLLGAVSDEPLAGLYSIWHDNAVYKYGHDHEITIRLARMFSLVLDARKSGLRVKKEVFAKDRFEHSGKIEWRAHKNEEVDEGRGEKEIFRSRDLPTFIMDRLLSGVVVKGADVLRSFSKDVKREHESLADYNHLSAALSAKIAQINHVEAAIPATGEIMRNALERVRHHVATCKVIWDTVRLGQLSAKTDIAEQYAFVAATGRLPVGARTPSRRSPQKVKGARPESALRTAHMQHLTKIWQEGLTIADVPVICADHLELKRLKIGCAAEASPQRWLQVFPLDMDFTTALQLKGEGIGATSTILTDSLMAKKPTWRAER